MNPSWESIAVGIGMLATMAAYALFVGADFGGGIWDLLAGRSPRGEQARAAIDRSVTPVWEGNQVWIVLGLVLLWTAFPRAFSAVMTALFVPLALSLLGLLFRGVGFAFRHETQHPRTKQLTGVLFGVSSVLAPFFLGASVGAVATGRVTADASGNVVSAWTSPTALMTGALFVASCAYIGAVYLVGDVRRLEQDTLIGYFSRRALVSGAVTGVLAAVNLVLLHGSAPYVFHRLLGTALPLAAASVAGGLAAMVLIVLDRPWPLRFAAAVAVAGVIAAWGLAQYPWLLPKTLSLQAGSAPATSLQAELIVLGMALLLVVPAFAYLYWLQQRGDLRAGDPDTEPHRRAEPTGRGMLAPATPQRSGTALPAAVAGAAGVFVVRAVLQRIRDRRGRRGG